MTVAPVDPPAPPPLELSAQPAVVALAPESLAVGAIELLLDTDQLEAAGLDLDALRTHVNALDDAIIELIVTRSQLSLQIEKARISAGGPRIMLSQERAVRSRYRAVLGTAGGPVADAMLRACRGSN